MSKAHVTIHDIAKELNISASTVSRALHNHPRISLATREAVRKVAEEYNYQPNVMASSLRQGRSNTVGVVVPRINRHFFANVIGGMEEVLAASGYHMIICQTHEKLKNEISAIHTLVNARVEAILLSVSMETFQSDHITAIRDNEIKLFFFDRIIENIQVGSVVIDDKLGAYMNTKHLLDQGYRKIIHVTGSEQINIYKARKQGYLKAMTEAGIEIQPGWIIEKHQTFEGGEEAFSESLKLKPDAFFCAGDYAALGVMQAALKKGIQTPTDLGLTGFSNEPFTAYMKPSLTTVDQMGEEMGQKMADMFLRSVKSDIKNSACEQIVLKPELIIRESSVPNK